MSESKSYSELFERAAPGRVRTLIERADEGEKLTAQETEDLKTFLELTDNQEYVQENNLKVGEIQDMVRAAWKHIAPKAA